MAFADYSFSGRLTATPGACRVLRNSARARRAFVGEAFAFACSRGDGRDYQMKDRSLAGVSLRWFRGGVIAFLPWGQNYVGNCWRIVNPATGWPGAAAFAIRRGTGEILNADGTRSLMPSI